MIGVVAALLVAPACSDPVEIDVQVFVPGGWTRARRVEVAVVGDCQDVQDWRLAPTSAERRAFATPEVAQSLGNVRAGSYGLHARALDRDCLVFADGCTAFDVDPERASQVSVHLQAVTTELAACFDGRACDDGACVRPGGGDGDADADADADTDADADADADADEPFCNDDCVLSRDGDCQDGGSGAQAADCDIGSDCTDCGARVCWAGPDGPGRGEQGCPCAESSECANGACLLISEVDPGGLCQGGICSASCEVDGTCQQLARELGAPTPEAATCFDDDWGLLRCDLWAAGLGQIVTCE